MFGKHPKLFVVSQIYTCMLCIIEGLSPVFVVHMLMVVAKKLFNVL
jgi:hypothetical protein